MRDKHFVSKVVSTSYRQLMVTTQQCLYRQGRWMLHVSPAGEGKREGKGRGKGREEGREGKNNQPEKPF
jgi:hypothetical protein